MIYGKISEISKYIDLIHDSSLKEVLKLIQNGDFKSLKTEHFYTKLIDFVPVNIEDKLYEAHCKYYDVHVILEGKEAVSVCHISDLINCTPYDEQADIYFGDCQRAEFSGELEPGYFLVTFSEDAHRVGVKVKDNPPSKVKKLIFKVKI